jgi:uncharacterized protein YceK
MKKVLAVFVIAMLSGCGTSLTLETYRIDERQESQKMHDRPLKCWFVSCSTEAQGS